MPVSREHRLILHDNHMEFRHDRRFGTCNYVKHYLFRFFGCFPRTRAARHSIGAPAGQLLGLQAPTCCSHPAKLYDGRSDPGYRRRDHDLGEGENHGRARRHDLVSLADSLSAMTDDQLFSMMHSLEERSEELARVKQDTGETLTLIGKAETRG
jgi:hypothetical protein